MKPDNPIVYNEFYLDAMTGGSSELPAPVTPEQHYLAHLAGMTVTLPQPIILRDMFLAKICGMDVDVPTYIPGKFPRKFAYYAKAAGQDVDVPQPITREEMYWFDYVSTPSEKEYTGAVPVIFTANGQPLLDYLISGNTVQSATPTPDSPVMPQGTGERTGNLYNINAKDVNNGYVNNAQLSQDGTTATWGSAEISEYIPISGDTAYTFNGIGSYNSPCYGLYDENKQLIGAYRYNGAQIIKFTSPNNARYFRFTHIKTATRAMMVEGAYTTSTMPDYEPYGIKIPISSANTTTPIYLGEVQTTRRIKKLVLTGEETIPNNDGASYNSETSTDRFVRDIPLSVGDNGTSEIVLCTHLGFQAQSWAARTKTGCCIYCSGSTMQLHLRFNNNTLGVTQSDTNEQRTAKLKAFLATQYAAGTPVTVWYVLATEETGIVNEPLMKIGEYADTLSMEQAVVEIPTARGTNTLDVLTDVKPSEIYIKYKE